MTAGNLDGDFAPHTRISSIFDAVGSLRSQHKVDFMDNKVKILTSGLAPYAAFDTIQGNCVG